ncbi:GDSL-type esterase/lipase family protein [Methylobacterium brachiatum]|uniref:GDSL-type esterase/lipase family protein n=1 Tax=Methylobacterium brachiatum TaxID=269660 RepID=UPI001428BF7D|nr:GDSL-type esterase/lipase family protein [Methylobacterium brachiatum]
MSTLVFGAFVDASAQADPRRILIYGDSNTWGYVASPDGQPARRYGRNQRWTALLQKALGESYEVLEDGLNLRTTDLDGEAWPDSIIRPDTVNGSKHLPTAIAANMPLDLAVIMLGTNDLQTRYQRSPQQIADAAVGLARQVRASSGGIGNAYPAPEVLLVSPVQVTTIPIQSWSERYDGAQEKSRHFAEAFERAAREAKIPSFDAGHAIGGAAHGADGLHLSLADHRRLAAAIAPVILKTLGAERR